ncbi:MAG: lytic murein transglycosylase [Zetaproteobacteria bacterium CG1_02_53_45]|nr:MAG: lytic murein transglycosylase [Zetaproteobacteria bacterium CG1_02_53_45]
MAGKTAALLFCCCAFSASLSAQSFHKPEAQDETTLTAQHGTDLLHSKLKQSRTLQPVQATDPLLRGLSDEDLQMAEAQARKHFSRSWDTTMERSRFVRYRLNEKLSQLGAPASLQMIPVVESTYNPYALSHAGALGLWQLMPKTARSLGIDSNKKVNGRRDINRSSKAAIQYLLQLHDRYDNWPLALAAYNMGPNGLSRRLKQSQWDIADGLENMPIPVTTRAYVQQIIGLASLVNKNMLSLPEPIRTQAIKLEPPVDIHALEALSGMQEDDIFRFNPSLNQAQYFTYPVTIHVPEASFSKVHSNITHAGPKFVQASVKPGDSLWSIAKEYGTTVEMLNQLNRNLGKYLRAGQRLKVPANQLAKASADENPLLPSSHRIRYKVRAGDSLWGIASRFGTTAKAIAQVNSLSLNSTIRAGDTLWVLAHRVQSS